MLRLAHRVMTQRLFRQRETGVGESVRELIPSSEILIADNVAQLFYDARVDEIQRTGGAVFPKESIPNARLPFPRMFVEWESPECMRELHAREGNFRTVGHLLFESTPSESGFECPTERVVVAAPVIFGSDGRCYDPGVVNFIAVEPDGRIHSAAFRDDPALPAAGLMMELMVSLLAISFMHCKNVVRSDATEQAGPTPKWLRRMKAPRLTYRVLQIGPMRDALRSEGGIETNGLKKALHICRGHFAHYSDEAPLFGKYTGQFWKPSHVRGSLESGAVVKDYAVKTQ